MVSQRSFNNLVILLTNDANSRVANDLAKEILNRRLAACVNLREVSSHFWWDGEIQQSNEVQLFIKTTKDQLQNLIKTIESLHSYQTPELLFWNASASDSYLNWVEAESSISC